MNIVTYFDNDNLNKPPAGDIRIYAVDNHVPMTREGLLQKYPLVIRDGVGLLDGEYHI